MYSQTEWCELVSEICLIVLLSSPVYRTSPCGMSVAPVIGCPMGLGTTRSVEVRSLQSENTVLFQHFNHVGVKDLYSS